MKKLNSWSMVAAAAILTACSANDYVGDTPLSENKVQGSIVFEGTPAHVTNGTRATDSGEDAAAMLGGVFNVYGVKNSSTTENVFTPIFKDETIWWAGDEKGEQDNTANTDGWEYVSDVLGSNNLQLPSNSQIKTTAPYSRRSTLEGEQKIKYWDSNSPSYWFYAISAPVSSNTNTWKWNTASDGLVENCKVENVGDDNTIFYADAFKASSTGANKGNAVSFTFKHLMAKVRFAFYERVKGYAIKDVKFYNVTNEGAWNDEKSDVKNDILILKGNDNKQFIPGDGSASYNIAYSTTDGKASLSYADEAETNKEYSKSFGKLLLDRKMPNISATDEIFMANGIDKADPNDKNSAYSWVVATDGSTDASSNFLGKAGDYYWKVVPTEADADHDAITIKIDYTLVANVTGGEEQSRTATVTIPKDQCKWEANHAYTYKFKLSGDGNVISFDADVEDFNEANDNDKNEFVAQ